uniref:Uncharacterized protein n=1 Tax=Rhizophora mucronata TaxID=61149 RepID=A0A2P2NX27_RHIMU
MSPVEMSQSKQTHRVHETEVPTGGLTLPI